MKKSKANEKDYTEKLAAFKMKPLPEEEHIGTKKTKRYCKKYHRLRGLYRPWRD